MLKSLAAISMLALTIPAHAETGLASIYSGKYWEGGSKSANGEKINPGAFTAAHKTLPFGTTVRVRHARNGKEVVVRINDRGPFVRGRVIDLTPAGAKKLGFDRHQGLAPVILRVEAHAR